MKTEIQKVLNFKKFFKVSQSNANLIRYNLKRPSILLMNNIYINWLQFINTKTNKHLPIFSQKKFLHNEQKLPFGFIGNNLIKYDENTLLEHNVEDNTLKKKSDVELNLIVPKQDITQYFIQWQRYRKYWWSSITTTPSLFTINEKKLGDNAIEADVIAQFPWGNCIVESISTNSETILKSSQLKCSLTLENAMLVLLLDGHNNTRNDYLRLHRNMAPYKISFALQATDLSKINDLIGLAKLMFYRLKSKNISTCMPDFKESLEEQIRENLHLGVTYTAILYDNTLTNGIFHLLNSGTMLKEEMHVAVIESYASLLCKK